MATRKNTLAAQEAAQAALDEAKPKRGRPRKPLPPGEKPRRGPGRPKGSGTVRNANFVKKIEAGKLVLWEAGQMLPDNCTPLDIMWAAARIAWATKGPFAAFEFAKECAPYVHAKISSIQLQPPKPALPPDARQNVPLVEFVDPEVAEILGYPATPEPAKEG